MLNSFMVLTSILILYLNYMFFSSWGVLLALVIFFLFLFFIKNQHLTISLIQLEVLGLMSLFISSNEVIIKEKELLFLFVLLVIIVIEASLGLSLIVKQARHLNKEFFKFFF